MVFESNAKIQRYRIRDAPVILHIAGENIPAMFEQSGLEIGVPRTSACSQPEPEIRQSRSGLGTDGNVSQSAIIPRIIEILTLANKLEAGLDRLVPVGDRKVVVKLPLCGVEDLEQVAIAQNRRPPPFTAGMGPIRSNPGRLKVRIADPKLLTDIAEKGGLGNVLVKLNRIKAKSSFVQKIGVEGMRPGYDCVLHWLIRALALILRHRKCIR